MEPDFSTTLAQTDPPSTQLLDRSAPQVSPSVPSVPGYELLRVLGQGGMGIVYEARDTRLRRVVALKMLLLGGMGSVGERERMKLEAEAVAKLHHTGIVQIYEIGECASGPYLSLEYISGGSLNQRLDGHPWHPRDAALMIERIAEAIAVAHAANIVHRDLKPGNILLTEAGEPKISDFGLAKEMNTQHGPTVTGAVLGTPSYMAPEQAEGKLAAIGAGTDLYSLGAMLYELLTGKPPFVGVTLLDTLDQVRKVEPVAPSRLNPRTPRDLDTICLKCLAKESHKRYASGQELAEDLRRFREGLPILARPVGPMERLVKSIRRNRTAACVVMGIFVLLICGLLVLGVAYRQTDTARRELESNLYITNLALAERECSVRHFRKAEEFLSACPAHLRGWEWHCLDHLRQHLDRPYQEHQAVLGAVTLSPDGRWVASAGEDHTVRVWDPRTLRTRLVHRVADDEQILGLSFSPDGQTLAAASQSRAVYLIDLAGNTRRTLGTHDDVVNDVAFSPDGGWLASASDDGTLRIWDATSGAQLHRVQVSPDPLYALSIRPDGHEIATAGADRVVRLCSVDSREITGHLEGHGGVIRGVCYSPDGKLLASCGEDRTVRVWDPARGLPQTVLHGHSGPVWACGFTRDGRILSASWDQTVKVWHLASQQELLTLHAHSDSVQVLAIHPDRAVSGGSDMSLRVWEVQSPPREQPDPLETVTSRCELIQAAVFSPSGDRIAYTAQDGNITVWNRAKRGVERVIPAHRSAVTALDWSPDGALLASGGQDKTCHLWEVATGQCRQTFRGHTDGITALRFAPDGRRVLSAGRDGKLRLWEASSGQEVHRFIGHVGWATAVAWAPDGGRIVSGGNNGTTRVWDPHTGQQLQKFLTHRTPVFDVAISRQGQIATATGDGQIRLWNAPDSPPRELSDHSSRVYGIAFSPDGTLLASVSEDETLRLWEVATGQPLTWFRAHAGPINEVQFSPSGQELLTAGDDGHIHLWSVEQLLAGKSAAPR